MRERYIELLGDYLYDHFGRPASAQVRERLAPLLARGRTDLVVNIIRALIERFDDRQSLPEELAEMLPPARKKDLSTL